MLVHPRWSFARACALAVALVSIGSGLSTARAASPESQAGKVSDEAKAVELFAGIEAGDVEALVVPRDSTRLTLQLRNKSDRPLAIKVPEAFAAVPVQPQIGFGAGIGGGDQLFGGGQNGGGNQALGAGGGQNGGRRNRGGDGLPGFGGPGAGAGIFNVPAGKAVKVKLPCVCLEYGKPDPTPKIPYEIRPLASFSDKPEIATLLRTLGDGEVSQEIAQLAAWNLANGLSWEEMASLKSRLGLRQPLFATSDIAAARKLVELVAAAKVEKSASSSQSAAIRGQ